MLRPCRAVLATSPLDPPCCSRKRCVYKVKRQFELQRIAESAHLAGVVQLVEQTRPELRRRRECTAWKPNSSRPARSSRSRRARHMPLCRDPRRTRDLRGRSVSACWTNVLEGRPRDSLETITSRPSSLTWQIATLNASIPLRTKNLGHVPPRLLTVFKSFGRVVRFCRGGPG